jgi:hypothetical protein
LILCAHSGAAKTIITHAAASARFRLLHIPPSGNLALQVEKNN